MSEIAKFIKVIREFSTHPEVTAIELNEDVMDKWAERAALGKEFTSIEMLKVMVEMHEMVKHIAHVNGQVYTTGWLAGRMQDERIDVEDRERMDKLVREAEESFRRWVIKS